MKFSGMTCHRPMANRLDFGNDQAEVQDQGHEQVKNYWTELHEIFRDDLSSSKDQSIRFCEQSSQRSRSRSRKGQKHIFVIARSVFVRFIRNQRQNVHLFNPLSSDMMNFFFYEWEHRTGTIHPFSSLHP